MMWVNLPEKTLIMSKSQVLQMYYLTQNNGLSWTATASFYQKTTLSVATTKLTKDAEINN